MHPSSAGPYLNGRLARTPSRSQTLGKSWLSTYDDHCTVSSSECVEPSGQPDANSSPFRVLDEGALVSCAT